MLVSCYPAERMVVLLDCSIHRDFVPKFSFVAVNIDMGFDPSYMSYDTLGKHLGKTVRLCNGENGYWRCGCILTSAKRTLLSLLASAQEENI